MKPFDFAKPQNFGGSMLNDDVQSGELFLLRVQGMQDSLPKRWANPWPTLDMLFEVQVKDFVYVHSHGAYLDDLADAVDRPVIRNNCVFHSHVAKLEFNL